MNSTRRTALGLALLLLLAFCARLGAGVYWQSRLPAGARFALGDSEGYWQLGLAISRGGPYVYEPAQAQVFRMPGYPLLLAGMFHVTGPSTACARALSALLGAVAVGEVYWLARRLFDERTGLWAALGAALEPSCVATGGLVLSEALFGSLLMLQFLFWHQGWRASERRWAGAYLLAAGLVAGLATLVRPGWLLFTPLCVCIGIVFSRERKRHTREAGLLLVGLVVVMIPWWVRNARVTGRFVPTTLQVGAALYDGLNPQATGGSNFDVVQAREALLRRALRADGAASLPPVEFRLNQALCREAIAWARDHAGAALRLAAVKFSRTWNVWPNEPTLRSPLARTAVLATYGPILVLALVGVFRYGCRGWPYAWCWLPAVYLTGLHLVFVGSIRYRQPAMLTLVILAAAVVAERYGKRNRSLASEARS